ncbi:MAG: hypothetical protein AB3N14_16800 [Flavobacteriaceae bacterium]
MKSTLNPDFNKTKKATERSTSAANFNFFGKASNANLYLRHGLVHTSC